MARVLVVDDEPMIVMVLRHVLQFAGFEVLEACDGEQALEIVAAERPDVVVLDIMMPKLDGWSVLQAMRDDPATAETPVVMLTALSRVEDELQSTRRGADRHLTKPFEPDDLVEILRALLDGQAEQ